MPARLAELSCPPGHSHPFPSSSHHRGHPSPSSLHLSVKYQELLAEFPEIDGLGLALSSMTFTTMSRRRRAGQSPLWRAAWTRRSMPLQRPSFIRWRRHILFAEQFTLVLCPSHGAETLRFLVPLWRFSPTQQRYSAQLVPRSEHL